jgi:3-deoxy-D-arabino-heptulosonate 7-phosphate (DAHP) synthase
MPILAPYKMASLEVKKERTTVRLGKAGAIGGTKIGVIAGPCSVEDRVHLLEIATRVRKPARSDSAAARSSPALLRTLPGIGRRRPEISRRSP